jgi:hypothetical protein
MLRQAQHDELIIQSRKFVTLSLSKGMDAVDYAIQSLRFDDRRSVYETRECLTGSAILQR